MRFRVLITPEWYPWPEQPGFGVFCREQAVVASLAHDVVVVTWRSDGALQGPVAVSEGVENGIRTFRIRFRASPLPRLSSVYKLVGVFTVIERLRYRDGWRPDIVHAHEYSAGRLASLAARTARAPMVISEHLSDFVLGRLERDELERAAQMFRRAAVVAPVSRDLAHRITPLVGDTPVHVVPNPVDTALFRPGGSNGSVGTRLLTVGSLIARKGHGHLVDALKRIVDDGGDVSLDIVGDGPLRHELQQRVEGLGMSQRVSFHGHLAKAAIADAMRTADVFVLPSLGENLPCVLLEAMASGLPTVASRVGGIPEVIDASAGVLVDPGSSEDLAAGLNKAIHTRHEYQAQLLHERAARRYGYKAIGHRWTDIYDLARGATK